MQRTSPVIAMTPASWIKPFAALLALAVLSACANGRDLNKPPPPLGDFQLGHNIVIAPNLVMGPLSREATAEEWTTSLEKAIEDRFRRYEGEKLYHFGISIEGYVLAEVGVPLVLQPKSVMIFRLTVWDDAAGGKLNAEAEEITVLEAISPESLAGSGLTQTREEQLDNLTVQAAKQIEAFLLRKKKDDGWFVSDGPVGEATPEEAAAFEEAVAGTTVEEPVDAVTDPAVGLFPEETDAETTEATEEASTDPESVPETAPTARPAGSLVPVPEASEEADAAAEETGDETTENATDN